MKAVFNCSTNLVGGGVKNSSLFIVNVLTHGSEFDWVFIVSPQVNDLVSSMIGEGFDCYVLSESPSKSLASRKRLKKLVKMSGAKFVYTMAGPAYVKFDIPHIMGVSNPFITHGTISDEFIGQNYLSGMIHCAATMYQSYYADKADYWIFQTVFAKYGFVNRKHVSESSCFVVSNSFDSGIFSNDVEGVELDESNVSGVATLFCPAEAYSHKALHYLPSIAKSYCDRYTEKISFVLSIQPDSVLYKNIIRDARRLGVADCISTVGRYDYQDCFKHYLSSDIIFVPSLLETFSATYLEAFVFRKPLIVADRQFAHEVCGDGAMYVDPKKSDETAKIINSVLLNDSLKERMITSGLGQLDAYSNQYVRTKNILDILGSLF